MTQEAAFPQPMAGCYRLVILKRRRRGEKGERDFTTCLLELCHPYSPMVKAETGVTTNMIKYVIIYLYYYIIIFFVELYIYILPYMTIYDQQSWLDIMG